MFCILYRAELKDQNDAYEVYLRDNEEEDDSD